MLKLIIGVRLQGWNRQLESKYGNVYLLVARSTGELNCMSRIVKSLLFVFIQMQRPAVKTLAFAKISLHPLE